MGDAAEDPLPGAVGGDVTSAEIEAVARRRRVFCAGHGWRDLGYIVNPERMTVIDQHGRLRGALVFDLGESGDRTP